MKEIIRSAKVSDAQAIGRLWRRFMAEEPEAVPDPQIDAAEQQWKKRLDEQIATSKVIVVEIAEMVCGFLGYIDSADYPWIPEGVAYVVDIYVAPEARTSTAARRLLCALLEAGRRAYSEVWTNTNVRNKRMRTLLSRFGFVPLSDFTIPDLENQVYFRLVLRNA
jgi:RimJ/RimL family protein N-acetyltransferase